MKTRIIAGLFAAIILVSLIFYASMNLLTGVVLLVSLFSYYEFEGMFFPEKNKFRTVSVLVFILLTVFAIRVDLQSAFLALIFSFCILAIHHVLLVGRRGDNRKIVQSVSSVYLGYLYIVTLTGFILPILEWPELGRYYFLLLCLWVFVGDTTAYFVGKFFGKHTLASHISPKKTLEGAAGAVFSSVVVGFVWLYFILPNDWDLAFGLRILLFAPLVSILAQLGDLFESMLKRSKATKDSGAFLPGHGGLLDRIDGLVFAAPAFYLFLQYVLEGTL